MTTIQFNSTTAPNLILYAVLAGSDITNTGTTTITGGVYGASSGAVTGGGTIIGILDNNPHAASAQLEWITINNAISALGVGTNIGDLASATLTPGVYTLNTNSTLGSGFVTLDGQNNPNAQFIFKRSDASAGAMTFASGTEVRLINGAQQCNVFWQSSTGGIVINTTASLVGNFFAYNAITVATGATIGGRLLVSTAGPVTLDTNTISVLACLPPIVPPVINPTNSICPACGCSEGGTQVSIRGSGFTDIATGFPLVTSVTFGGYPAVFVVNSNTLITVLTPPFPYKNTVSIVICNGVVCTTLAKAFTYVQCCQSNKPSCGSGCNKGNCGGSGWNNCKCKSCNGSH